MNSDWKKSFKWAKLYMGENRLTLNAFCRMIEFHGDNWNAWQTLLWYSALNESIDTSEAYYTDCINLIDALHKVYNLSRQGLLLCVDTTTQEKLNYIMETYFHDSIGEICIINEDEKQININTYYFGQKREKELGEIIEKFQEMVYHDKAFKGKQIVIEQLLPYYKVFSQIMFCKI
jgi:hypothetical protein